MLGFISLMSDSKKKTVCSAVPAGKCSKGVSFANKGAYSAHIGREFLDEFKVLCKGIFGLEGRTHHKPAAPPESRCPEGRKDISCGFQRTFPQGWSFLIVLLIGRFVTEKIPVGTGCEKILHSFLCRIPPRDSVTAQSGKSF